MVGASSAEAGRKKKTCCRVSGIRIQGGREDRFIALSTDLISAAATAECCAIDAWSFYL
jgi:hypothetical protein